MNSIERAIAAVSPKWAAERAYFRALLDLNDAQARAYNAAKLGRRGDGWNANRSSANSELSVAAIRIRDRARDLVRNNPYAAGFPRKMASKIVGSGIMPRLALSGSDNKDQRKKATGIWDRFADNCDPEGQTDFYGQQSLVARAVSESGEAIVRTVRLPSRANAFPLYTVVQEGDYIDSARNMELDNGNIVIQGIEHDSYGRRVAYWLFDYHPGDSLIRFTKRVPQSQRVDARDVDHIFEPLRPGQVRGVSMFASVAMKMRDLDDYDDAELMRKKIASCFAAFVTRPNGNVTSPLVKADTSTEPGGDSRRIERINPAMIKYLQPGEDVEFGSPPNIDGYTDYHFGQLYAVAAGLGCTFEQLTGNLRGVNFSSIRVGINDFNDLLDHLQWHVYVPQLCRRMWNRVGQVARITGELGLADDWNARWIMPARRWLDPANDVVAKKDAARALLTSPLDAIAEQGYDPEDVLEETAEFNRRLDELGLISDIDPRRVGRTSTATPAQAPKDDSAASAA